MVYKIHVECAKQLVIKRARDHFEAHITPGQQKNSFRTHPINFPWAAALFFRLSESHQTAKDKNNYMAWRGQDELGGGGGGVV